MRGSEPGTARQEAERLVVTAVRAARVAAGGAAARVGHPVSCACPVCRTLAAVRDPDPAVVQRLASRAGDAAAGVAGLMRSASAAWRGPEGPAPADDVSRGAAPADDVWRAATRHRHTGPPAQQGDDVWSAATRSTGEPAGRVGNPAGRADPAGEVSDSS
jgi:hypothetical protein